MKVTLSEFRAIKRRAAERKAKRAEKASVLWPARKKRTRPKSRRELLRARLDALWSFFIKMRDRRRPGGMCRICGSRPIEVAYHIVPRGDDAVRWDVRNGCGACFRCNYGEVMNRSRYRSKHVEKFGKELIEELEQAARMPARFSLTDFERIKSEIEDKIKGTK